MEKLVAVYQYPADYSAEFRPTSMYWFLLPLNLLLMIVHIQGVEVMLNSTKPSRGIYLLGVYMKLMVLGMQADILNGDLPEING